MFYHPCERTKIIDEGLQGVYISVFPFNSHSLVYEANRVNINIKYNVQGLLLRRLKGYIYKKR